VVLTNRRTLAMKNKMLVLAAAVGLTLPIAASTAEAADASSGQKSSAGTYTGCLAKGDGPNEFKLTNVNGGNEEYELIGGKDLKDHIGHKVEVKGKEVSAKQATKAEKASGAAEKGESEAAHEHIRVSSMRHIAETCP
jgi:ABC-type glycerol-3-phosphate transport system substrate-binding protein